MNISQNQLYKNYVHNNLVIDLYFEKCKISMITENDSVFDIMLEFPNIIILLCCNYGGAKIPSVELALDEYKHIINEKYVICIIDTTADAAKYCRAKLHPRDDIIVTEYGCRPRNVNGLVRVPSYETRYNALLEIINAKKNYMRDFYLRALAYIAGILITYIVYTSYA